MPQEEEEVGASGRWRIAHHSDRAEEVGVGAEEAHAVTVHYTTCLKLRTKRFVMSSPNCYPMIIMHDHHHRVVWMALS